MSDIKYIIAGRDDDGEHTRFGCLAMVRYAVAAVVTVLTITVIALSIHAVLRSEDMGLSVNKGFIGADTLWSHMFSPPVPSAGQNHPTSSINKVAEPATAAAKLSRRRGLLALLPEASDETDVNSAATTQVSVGSSSSRSLPKDCFLGCSGGDRDEPTQVTFKKADRTNLRIILIANNPGGRTKGLQRHPREPLRHGLPVRADWRRDSGQLHCAATDDGHAAETAQQHKHQLHLGELPLGFQVKRPGAGDLRRHLLSVGEERENGTADLHVPAGHHRPDRRRSHLRQRRPCSLYGL